jgi:hypothetical protein
LLGCSPTQEASWSDVVICHLLLDTAAQFKCDIKFPVAFLIPKLIEQFFNITQPIPDTAIVTWKCGNTDKNTLLNLCVDALSVIHSETATDALSPYTPLPKRFLEALTGLHGTKKHHCLPTFEEL